MKAILEFNLDDSEDKERHLRCVKATDICLTLWDFDQWLRSEIKYNEKDYREVRNELYRQMEEYGINLDELIT